MGIFGSVGGLISAFVTAPVLISSASWQAGGRRLGPVRRKRIRFDPSIKALVVVAGVSGSGKSTFIKQLLTADLSEEIASRLPRDISQWNFVGEKVPKFTRFLGRAEKQPSGQIVHYEITQAYMPAPEGAALPPAPDDYWACEDIRFMRMLAAAERVYLVVVEAPGEQVANQLGCRSSLLHVPTPLRPLFARWGGSLRTIEARLPNGLSTKASKILGRRWRHRSRIRERNDRLIELYLRPSALEAIHQEWLRTLQEAWGRRIVGEALRVRPVGSNGEAHFVIHGTAGR